MAASYPHHRGVSNTIRYDSLLVRELARELDAALAGARLIALWLDRERLRLTLQAAPARRSDAEPPSLIWQLHPEAGHITPAGAAASAARADAQGARVPQRPRAPITRVSAPPDERILTIDVDAGDAPAGAARRVIVELVTNQWNVIVTGADDRIVSVLRERETRERVLRNGAVYVPPRPSGRAGVHAALTKEEWRDSLARVAPADRLRELPRLAAWVSPLNAAWVLGSAGVSDDAGAVERAYARYRSLVEAARLQPVLLADSGRWQPYVAVDTAAGGAEVMPSLLAAFAEAAVRVDAAPPPEAAVEDALAAVARRLDALAARTRRLEEEQAGAAEEAQRLRAHADLLLSQLQRVQRGAPTARLDDFAGGSVEVELDPLLAPAENAKAMYDTARRRDRAAARVPRLLASIAEERARLEALAARVRDGVATADELERLRRRGSTTGRDAAPALPYRLYRSSGGLEIRVGRGARANDELTFRHSRPGDIWLHARDVGGAHVVLRWDRTDENPPARDIEEAAVLAALHSRARTSGTVPVDWTRRRYVRKPRRAAPGLVLPERVRTVFVHPDPALEERLRVEDAL